MADVVGLGVETLCTALEGSGKIGRVVDLMVVNLQNFDMVAKDVVDPVQALMSTFAKKDNTFNTS